MHTGNPHQAKKETYRKTLCESFLYFHVFDSIKIKWIIGKLSLCMENNSISHQAK